MSAVQLAVAGRQKGITGTAVLTVTDPNNEVQSVAFVTADNTSVRSEPLPPDRNPSAGVYERDVPLLRNSFMRVEPQVELLDGTIVRAAPLMFGARSEPLDIAPGTLASLTLTTQARRLDVAAPLGSGTSMSCFARRGAWPTRDGLLPSSLADEYLRFEGDAAAGTSFFTAAEPGTWYVVAAAYNSAGQQGPLKSAFAEVPA